MWADFEIRLIKATGAQVLGQGSQILIRLVEVPLFLHFWGVQLYGEWLVLASLPIYLSISDLGFGSVAVRQMIMLVAGGKKEAALSVFQSSSILILGLSGSFAFAFVFAIWALPVIELFNISKIDSSTFLLTAALLSLQIVVSGQTLLLFGGYASEGRYPFGFLFLNFIQVGQFCLLAATVFLGGGPVLAAIAMLSGQIIGTIGFRLSLLRVNSWLHYGTTHIRLDMIRDLAKPALASIAFPLGQTMSQQGARLVIASLLGPVAVVVFATHRQLARLINTIVPLAYPFQVELSARHGAGELDRFKNLSRRTFQILVWAVFGSACVAYLIGRPVFVKWTGGHVDFSPALLLLLLLATVVEAIWLIALTTVISTNRHTKIAAVYAPISFAMLGLIAGAARTIGLNGAAAVLIAADFTMAWVVIRSMLSLTGDHFGQWFKVVACPPFFVVKRYLTERAKYPREK